MKTDELMAMLKTAEQLGIKDIPIMSVESIDGKKPQYHLLTARFEVDKAPGQNGSVILVMGINK